MPGGYSVVLGTIGVIEREDTHAVINWGVNWWGTQCPILETAVRRGAFLIAGQNWTGEGAMCAMFTDLVAVCEELTAAGVYVSGDPVGKCAGGRRNTIEPNLFNSGDLTQVNFRPREVQAISRARLLYPTALR